MRSASQSGACQISGGWPLTGSTIFCPRDCVVSVEGRPVLRPTCSEAAIPLSARLRHAGLPLRAGPDIRLSAHPGRSAAFAGISEADIGAERVSRLSRIASELSSRASGILARDLTVVADASGNRACGSLDSWIGMSDTPLVPLSTPDPAVRPGRSLSLLRNGSMRDEAARFTSLP